MGVELIMNAVVEQKAQTVTRLADSMAKCEMSVFIDFKGMDVASVNSIRSDLYKLNASMEVAKNTLLKRASDQVGLSFPDDVFFSCTAIVSSENNGLELAKLVDKYCKDYENFAVKAGVFEKNVCDAGGIEQLSKLPSKEELIGKLLMLMKSPISNFIQGISTPIRKCVYVLDSVKDKKIKENEND